MPRVRFTQAARADLAGAVTWYVAHAPEVVPQFRQALRSVVERSRTTRDSFAPASHGTRRAILRRFPYLVIFREQGDAAYVVAVFHTSRDPRTWERRAAGSATWE